MKCPFCLFQDSKVIDSRLGEDGTMTRRRRECIQCHKRFTTYEKVEMVLPFVVKKDGRREAVDLDKIRAGIRKACEKRPISSDQIENIINSIQRKLYESGEKEIVSSRIGEYVMVALKDLDEVAYVRFASVYRQFKDISQFMKELKVLKKTNRKTI
ncbi:MAG: transcriptional repressor NrdR [Deltaproteobacteria bacterium]|nr:transcriptional repressor NrdR [Deltaproteobacteria bacterium]